MNKAIAIAVSAYAIVFGVTMSATAGVGIFDNFAQQSTENESTRDSTSYSHERKIDRAPAPAVPDCTGEETRSVPLLTFFFDTEKISDEPRTTARLFPCGTPPNDQTTLLDPVLVRPEDTED